MRQPANHATLSVALAAKSIDWMPESIGSSLQATDRMAGHLASLVIRAFWSTPFFRKPASVR
jgi:hypothetical protein